MRILISAYACEPDKGSEPEVGLRVALIAASKHDVWVVTRQNNLPSLQDYLRDHPLKKRIHLIGLDLEGQARRLKKRGGRVTLHWYYDQWQRQVVDVALSLDDEFDFDLVHHATFASYWTRVGVASVDKPLVWGPVGGGVTPPFSLLPIMGLRGGVDDVIRIIVRPVVARLQSARRTARRAAVLLVQNKETARRLHLEARALVLPNALVAVDSDVGRVSDQIRYNTPRIVAAGRLIGWKGTELAIRAMADIRHPGTILEIYGDGPQRDRLENRARRAGVVDRVQFQGTIPREKLLAKVAAASALVHPALHEEAGFVVAEALALGTPVVCLDRGGPPVILDQWPDVPSHLVPPSTPRRTAGLIARAIDELIGQRGPPNTEPASYFAKQLLHVYSAAANGSTS